MPFVNIPEKRGQTKVKLKARKEPTITQISSIQKVLLHKV